MYSVMRTVRSTYEIVEIKHATTSKLYVIDGYGVYMMHEYSPVYLVTLDSKVATVVPNYDVVTNTPPFMVMVENLVQISVVSECLQTNCSAEFQIVESLFECW